LVADAPWAAAAAFTHAVRSWAYSEADAVLLRRYLDKVGLLDDEGEPRNAAHLLGRVEGRLIKLRAELGLSPMSLGTLMSKAASVAAATRDEAALEALRAEGARILRARPELTVLDGGASPGLDQSHSDADGVS
jgi:hypothetical protein